MIDAALERRLRDARELQTLWRSFRDYFTAAIKQEPIDEAKELEFLKLKSKIAMLHDSYLDTIKSGQKVAQNIIALVGRSITLKHVSLLSVAESKKFEIEWHEAYLQIEETIGQLDEEHQRLAQITPAKYRMMNFNARVNRMIAQTLHSTVFKLGIVAVVLIALLGGAIAFNVVDALYKNPSLRPMAIAIKKGMRVVQPDLEYDDILEIVPEDLPGNKPGDFSHFVRGGGKKEDGAALATWKTDKGQSYTAVDDLAKADQYIIQEMEFKDSRERAIQLHYFRFKTTKEAKEIMDRFIQFTVDSGKRPRADPPGGEFSFFRKANVIVLLKSPNTGARDWLRKKLFGYQLDTDT